MIVADVDGLHNIFRHDINYFSANKKNIKKQLIKKINIKKRRGLFYWRKQMRKIFKMAIALNLIAGAIAVILSMSFDFFPR